MKPINISTHTLPPPDHQSHTAAHHSSPPSVVFVSTDQLTPGSAQPRTLFDDDAIRNLAQSIEHFGILQPLIVKPVSPELYEIIAGERRWRAACSLGHKTVPCLIRSRDDDDSLEIALIENIQRQDLTPIEEAQALADLIEHQHYTHDELSSRLGIPRATISNTLRLLQLPDQIKKLIHLGQLSAGHAKAILTLGSEEQQLKLSQIAASKGLSVRKTEELAKLMTQSQDKPSPNQPKLGANLRYLCDQYKGHLGTKVKITGDQERGRIEISYYSHEDLDRITELVLGDLSMPKN